MIPFKYTFNLNITISKGTSTLKKYVYGYLILEWVLEDIEKTINPPSAERLSEITKITLLIIDLEDSQPIKEIATVLESDIIMVQRLK